MASPGDPIRCAVSLAYVVTTCSLIRLTWLNVSGSARDQAAAAGCRIKDMAANACRFMAISSHDSANDADADKADLGETGSSTWRCSSTPTRQSARTSAGAEVKLVAFC